MQFDLRNGPLRKKFDGVKYDVRKVDDVLYELALLGREEDVGEGGEGQGEREEDVGGSRKRKEREEEGEEKGGTTGLVLDAEEFGAIRVAMTAFDEKR